MSSNQRAQARSLPAARVQPSTPAAAGRQPAAPSSSSSAHCQVRVVSQIFSVKAKQFNFPWTQPLKTIMDEVQEESGETKLEFRHGLTAVKPTDTAAELLHGTVGELELVVRHESKKRGFQNDPATASASATAAAASGATKRVRVSSTVASAPASAPLPPSSTASAPSRVVAVRASLPVGSVHISVHSDFFRTRTYQMRCTGHLQTLMETFSNVLGRTMHFFYNSQRVKPTDTPADLQLQHGIIPSAELRFEARLPETGFSEPAAASASRPPAASSISLAPLTLFSKPSAARSSSGAASAAASSSATEHRHRAHSAEHGLGNYEESPPPSPQAYPRSGTIHCSVPECIEERARINAQFNKEYPESPSSSPATPNPHVPEIPTKLVPAAVPPPTARAQRSHLIKRDEQNQLVGRRQLPAGASIGFLHAATVTLPPAHMGERVSINQIAKDIRSESKREYKREMKEEEKSAATPDEASSAPAAAAAATATAAASDSVESAELGSEAEEDEVDMTMGAPAQKASSLRFLPYLGASGYSYVAISNEGPTAIDLKGYVVQSLQSTETYLIGSQPGLNTRIVPFGSLAVVPPLAQMQIPLQANQVIHVSPWLFDEKGDTAMLYNAKGRACSEIHVPARTAVGGSSAMATSSVCLGDGNNLQTDNEQVKELSASLTAAAKACYAQIVLQPATVTLLIPFFKSRIDARWAGIKEAYLLWKIVCAVESDFADSGDEQFAPHAMTCVRAWLKAQGAGKALDKMRAYSTSFRYLGLNWPQVFRTKPFPPPTREVFSLIHSIHSVSPELLPQLCTLDWTRQFSSANLKATTLKLLQSNHLLPIPSPEQTNLEAAAAHLLQHARVRRTHAGNSVVQYAQLLRAAFPIPFPPTKLPAAVQALVGPACNVVALRSLKPTGAKQHQSARPSTIHWLHSALAFAHGMTPTEAQEAAQEAAQEDIPPDATLDSIIRNFYASTAAVALEPVAWQLIHLDDEPALPAAFKPNHVYALVESKDSKGYLLIDSQTQDMFGAPAAPADDNPTAMEVDGHPAAAAAAHEPWRLSPSIDSDSEDKPSAAAEEEEEEEEDEEEEEEEENEVAPPAPPSQPKGKRVYAPRFTEKKNKKKQGRPTGRSATVGEHEEAAELDEEEDESSAAAALAGEEEELNHGGGDEALPSPAAAASPAVAASPPSPAAAAASPPPLSPSPPAPAAAAAAASSNSHELEMPNVPALTAHDLKNGKLHASAAPPGTCVVRVLARPVSDSCTPFDQDITTHLEAGRCVLLQHSTLQLQQMMKDADVQYLASSKIAARQVQQWDFVGWPDEEKKDAPETAPFRLADEEHLRDYASKEATTIVREVLDAMDADYALRAIAVVTPSAATMKAVQDSTKALRHGFPAFKSNVAYYPNLTPESLSAASRAQFDAEVAADKDTVGICTSLLQPEPLRQLAKFVSKPEAPLRALLETALSSAKQGADRTSSLCKPAAAQPSLPFNHRSFLGHPKSVASLGALPFEATSHPLYFVREECSGWFHFHGEDLRFAFANSLFIGGLAWLVISAHSKPRVPAMAEELLHVYNKSEGTPSLRDVKGLTHAQRCVLANLLVLNKGLRPPPSLLAKHGIEFEIVILRGAQTLIGPGDCLHMGFNCSGSSTGIATNFASASWAMGGGLKGTQEFFEGAASLAALRFKSAKGAFELDGHELKFDGLLALAHLSLGQLSKSLNHGPHAATCSLWKGIRKDLVANTAESAARFGPVSPEEREHLVFRAIPELQVLLHKNWVVKLFKECFKPSGKYNPADVCASDADCCVNSDAEIAFACAAAGNARGLKLLVDSHEPAWLNKLRGDRKENILHFAVTASSCQYATFRSPAQDAGHEFFRELQQLLNGGMDKLLEGVWKDPSGAMYTPLQSAIKQRSLGCVDFIIKVFPHNLLLRAPGSNSPSDMIKTWEDADARATFDKLATGAISELQKKQKAQKQQSAIQQ